MTLRAPHTVPSPSGTGSGAFEPGAGDDALGAPSAPVSTAIEGSGSFLAWVGLSALIVGAVLVFWLFDALPFQDLPAHEGLIAMRHRFGGSPFEQRFFVLAPHIGPYSLFRFLGEGLVRVFGPDAAVRALATFPVLATPGALLFARRRLHGDVSPTAGFLGVTLSFGLMTLLGFASYLLGVAIMLVGLTLWLELLVRADRGERARKEELAVLCFAPLVFVAHGHAFVLFLMLAGVAAIVTGDRLRRLVRLRALVPAVLLAAWVAWIERGASTPPGSVAVNLGTLEPRFQGPSDKLSLLITPTLMTRSGIDVLVGVALWGLVFAGTFLTVRDLRARSGAASTPSSSAREDSLKHTRALLAGAAVITVVFLALPHAIGWFGFVDGRLVPIALFLALLAMQREALGRVTRTLLDKGAPVLATTMVALLLVASRRFQAEARGYREVLAHVPGEARLLNLPLDPNSDVFTAHPFIHYDKLVLAERPIVVSDVWFHQGSALYPTPENPALHLPSSYSESDLRYIDWPAYKLDDWDWVLIRTRPEAAAPSTPSRLYLADHRGGWWLYHRATL